MEYNGNLLRHELKYYINEKTYYNLRNRLKQVAYTDSNMPREDGYIISSIYFDDVYQTALNEKNQGVNFRKKYRIRTYEYSDKIIKLECKSKFGEYISKTSATLTRQEYDSILNDDYDFLKFRPEQVCTDVYTYNKLKLLKPVVTVEYLREAYIYPQGNVRVTFDKDLSASIGTVDIFSDEYMTTKVFPENLMVIEIKYDDFLPANIQKILKTTISQRSAISKYVICRGQKGLEGKI